MTIVKYAMKGITCFTCWKMDRSAITVVINANLFQVIDKVGSYCDIMKT